MNNITQTAFVMPSASVGRTMGILIMSSIGLFGNVLILLATWHSRQTLNSKSNWLIAALATFDAVSNVVTFEEGILGFMNLFPLVQCTCFYAIVPILFSINAGAAMIL